MVSCNSAGRMLNHIKEYRMKTIVTSVFAACDKNGDMYLGVGDNLVYGVGDNILAKLGNGTDTVGKNGKPMVLFGRWELDVETVGNDISILDVRRPAAGALAQGLAARLHRRPAAPAPAAAPAATGTAPAVNL